MTVKQLKDMLAALPDECIVAYHKPHKRFVAQLTYLGKRVVYKRFKTAKEASLYHDEMSKKYHGEFSTSK